MWEIIQNSRYELPSLFSRIATFRHPSTFEVRVNCHILPEKNRDIICQEQFLSKQTDHKDVLDTFFHPCVICSLHQENCTSQNLTAKKWRQRVEGANKRVLKQLPRFFLLFWGNKRRQVHVVSLQILRPVCPAKLRRLQFCSNKIS